ncbi:MAG: ABC transporter ATP-binding protein [Deltaproteobacteria bacterium]|nr:ABC transporter ATP-binding protein [Deltaproteobacteria bacterium]
MGSDARTAQWLVQARGLRVDYDAVAAVVDLDLDIAAGQIYGLIGPNGAGKTSTLRALAGLLEPTYGEVRIGGFDLASEPEQAWRLLGFMPDFPPVYERLSVGDYLEVFAAAYEVPRTERTKRAKHWAERVGLDGKWGAAIGTLSRGMRHRLVLAKTLLPEPSVLILDEPASGVDPIARAEMRDLLKEVAARGGAVLVSSHILPELSELCTAVGILEKGRLVVSGTLEEIRGRLGSPTRLEIRLADPAAIPRALEVVARHPAASEAAVEGGTRVSARFAADDRAAAALLAGLVAAGLPVSDFRLERDSVEDIFFRVGAREVS